MMNVSTEKKIKIDLQGSLLKSILKAVNFEITDELLVELADFLDTLAQQKAEGFTDCALTYEVKRDMALEETFKKHFPTGGEIKITVAEPWTPLTRYGKITE